MEHDYDYLNYQGGAIGSFTTGLYMTEEGGTHLDPYLYILPPSVTLLKILSGQTKILSGKLLIK